MAFVCVSQRKITDKSEKDCYPSPAHYTLDTSKISNEYAPFRSTSVRKIQFQKDSKNHIPGPGEYDIDNSFIKPKVTSYFCRNNVLVKLNSQGSAPFKSQTKRFDQSKEDLPSPASYQTLNSDRDFNQKILVCKKIKKKQSLSPPSIPSKGRGLLQILQKKQQLKQQEISPGPGSYDCRKNKKIISKGTVWAKDTIDRFATKQTIAVGPGNYAVQPQKQPPKVPEESSIFKSNTVRSFIDSIIYGSQVEVVVNHRKQNNFKSSQPAPGQYNINQSAFDSIPNKPIKYQFLGSSTQRFPQYNQENQNTTLFPNIQSINQSRAASKNNLPFNSKTQRDSSFLNLKNEKQATPGPDYYVLPLRLKWRKPGKEVGQFGSTSNRVPLDSKLQHQLGPGIYELEKAKMQIKNDNQTNNQSSFFKSQTKKCHLQHNSSLPEIGQYDVGYHDVAKRLERQRIHLQNLKKINVYKPPFQTSDSRFPHYQDWHCQQEFENPQYGIQIIKKNPLRFVSAIKQVPGAIFGKDERFHSMRKGQGVPGVGAYQYGQKWNKKSYNMRFKNQ